MCNVKEKSPIWQSFKILLMPDRYLFLLNSKVALSRSKSISFIKNIQQLSCLFCCSKLDTITLPTVQESPIYDFGGSSQRGEMFSFTSYSLLFLFFNKESAITYFKIVSDKKVDKFVCIDLVAC